MSVGVVIHGSGSNDVLNGTSGDDVFYVGAGGEIINGGDGADTAIFNITSSQVVGISPIVSGGYTVYSPLGVTALIGVETLSFTDQSFLIANFIASDSTPPVLASLTLNHSTVDVSSATQQIVFTAHITDNLSGNAGTGYSSSPSQIRFSSPTGTQSLDLMLDGTKLVSGTLQDGVYSSAITVPLNAEAGTWTASYAMVVDQVGNTRTLTASQLTAAGIPDSFTVTNNAGVIVFPVLIHDIESIGVLPDGQHLLVKTSNGVQAVDIGATLNFADGNLNASNLTQAFNPTPVFHTSGNSSGYTLPDFFTGLASLNLRYQLIENGDNAVVTGSSDNDFIKVSSSNSIGKAINGNGGSDVLDGGVGSAFLSGGASHNDTFFLDGRAPGISWSTITDFKAGTDKATIWGFVKGVSSIDASFTNYNNEGAGGYQGLTLHFKNLLPDGQTAGSNPSLNSITLSGHTLAEFGASSLADLNNQINNGTNAHFIVGATNDSLGTHGYLQVV